MTKKLVKITRETGIPLVGAIMFGVIDRGTNLLQIRATTICPLNCIYCSVDAGLKSKTRRNDYQVDIEYLIQWVKEVIKQKDCTEIEANIDSVGEPLAHPDVTKLVAELKKINEIKRISIQTNGVLLTKRLVDELEKYGLDQINLSFNTFDNEQGKFLSGCQDYNLDKIIEMAHYIAKSKITLLIAPVWIGKLNQEEMPKMIKFAKEIGAKLGIQKYEKYKLGRGPKEVKQESWWKFFNALKKWENEFDAKLKLSANDFAIRKTKSLPLVIDKNDKINATIVCDGWMNGQMIASARNRCITVEKCDKNIGDKVNVKILENKNNIYLGEMI